MPKHPAGTPLRDAENGSDALYAAAATGGADKVPLREMLQSAVVQRQALQLSLQASVLGLQLLEAACRGDLPTSVLRPPSIEGLPANPYLAAGFGDRAAPRNSSLGLAELVEHLLRRMLPLCQMSPPTGQFPAFLLAPFAGDGSVGHALRPVNS